MKKISLLILFIVLGTTAYSWDGVSFNKGWRFLNEESTEAVKYDFDDSSWRELDLPHDWAIEGPFSSKYHGRCGGLPFYGIGWYRKSFIADESWRDKDVRLAFDGAMNGAQVWVNGEFAAERPYGYSGFEVSLSPYLKFAEKNVIAVKLSPKDVSSRWYPGAGIYRNVWLRVDEIVHLDEWGVYVTTPTVTEAKSVVQFESLIENKYGEGGEYRVEHIIMDMDQEVAKVVTPLTIDSKESSKKVLAYTDVVRPHLWSVDTPYLYDIVTKLYCDDELLDQQTKRFGIRSVAFSKEGCFINGEKIRFNGVCLHADNGPLGTAVNVRADQRKLEIMKDMGVNAIRTSHNPTSPEFLDLCDEMGFVVLAEAFDEWRTAKVEQGYAEHYPKWSDRDLSDMIRRDRSHPSIIMWSIGNEVMEQFNPKQGFVEAKYLADICRREDPTRPSTLGINNNISYKINIAQQVDIVGMNYKPALYDSIPESYPDMLFYGSETSSCTSSRGVYHLPITKYEKDESLQITSYDIIGPVWAYPPDIEFYFQEKNPHIMGEFVWTGFDYLGEPTPFGGRDNFTKGHWSDDWPARSSYFGAVDLCGLPKDRFFLYQSQWSDKPMIHMLPHWNWPNGMDIPVYVYTNCDEAELFLNGRSLGRKVKGGDTTPILVDFNFYEPKSFDSKYRLSWSVPFEEGELTVKGYKEGEMILQESMRTAGDPAKITLHPDRKVIAADGKDLCYVTVRIEDKHGTLCPNGDNLVNFEVSGAGHFRAVGNGNAATTESFIEPRRKAFSGMCMLIVESDELEAGSINIRATSRGLKECNISINTEK